jgi:glycosyltransferase involved in cell wall biosynthesis
MAAEASNLKIIFCIFNRYLFLWVMQKLNNKFIVVIPVYNGEETIAHALDSVIKQEYEDLGVIIRDDMSVDRTAEMLKDRLGIDGIRSNYTVFDNRDVIFVRNNKKFYGGGNTYDSAINLVADKSSIVGVVDGDDKLIDRRALTKIGEIYERLDMWMVWSQHRIKSGIDECKTGCSTALPPDELIYANRDYWAVSHFRTCRAWLFNQLELADLEDPFCPQSFCKVAADAAFLYPMAEICGNRKSFFLDECLYLYNDVLESNDDKSYPAEVQLYTDYLRNIQKRYRQYEGPASLGFV